MIGAARVTEELNPPALINDTKEWEKNDFKNLRLLNFGENIKCRL